MVPYGSISTSFEYSKSCHGSSVTDFGHSIRPRAKHADIAAAIMAKENPSARSGDLAENELILLTRALVYPLPTSMVPDVVLLACNGEVVALPVVQDDPIPVSEVGGTDMPLAINVEMLRYDCASTDVLFIHGVLAPLTTAVTLGLIGSVSVIFVRGVEMLALAACILDDGFTVAITVVLTVVISKRGFVRVGWVLDVAKSDVAVATTVSVT